MNAAPPRWTIPAAALRRLCARALDRLVVWAPMLAALVPAQRAAAATLPEQRSDALYHIYDGGGQTVQGPAVLLRKNFAEKFSVFGGYYIDQISGASIDVVTYASPYHEQRREISGGLAYLYRDTLMSASYTDSNEHDYKARTYDFSVSQDMFENRTTLRLGYFEGNDRVGDVTNPSLDAKANRAGYSVSLAQVINPSLIGTLAFEGTADDGYLQNPYRQVLVQDHFQPQKYPGTRSGDAVSVQLMKSWSPNWSTHMNLRYYWDSWHVGAFDVTLAGSEYLTLFGRRVLLDESYRYYTQRAASFYGDNFQQTQDYMSRDKELAHFHSHTLGTKLTVPLYEHAPGSHSIINSVSVSAAFDYMLIDYKDFTDIRDGQLYGFNASIGQIFFTVRY